MSDSLIVNNTFDGNMANNAGADILMKDTGDPARNTVIDNCNFSNSKTMLYASSYGGDGASIMINNKNITIQNCNFVNTTVYKQNGGAIAIKSTDCKIINVTITNSSTLNGEGGAIFASSGANNIIINNVNITNAHSESEDAGKDANGGAIYCAAPNANIILVRIVNATSLYNFTDGGKSAHGGAIYFSNTGTMSNITVINSSASAANGKALGGAVYRTNGNLYHALFIKVADGQWYLCAAHLCIADQLEELHDDRVVVIPRAKRGEDEVCPLYDLGHHFLDAADIPVVFVISHLIQPADAVSLPSL